MPVLNVQDIPDELWLDGMLGMPMCLRMSYWNQLESYGLTEEALAPDTTGPQIVGGRSEEATRQHFARRYGVSASRIESLAIDPHRAFGVIPDDLLVSLSEGHISVLDVACGAGAVGASLLSTVSVLRATGRLPKMPLDVSIVGGDCSDSALVMYRQMIEELRPTLCAVGIEVDLVATRWEAEESYSTSEMSNVLPSSAIRTAMSTSSSSLISLVFWSLISPSSKTPSCTSLTGPVTRSAQSCG